MSKAQRKWPGESDEAYPEVFTKIPDWQPTEKKPGQLTQEQLRQYFEDGFVVIKDFFDTEKELEPALKDIADLVETVARKLYKAGKVKSLYSEYDVFHRLTKLCEDWPDANILLLKLGPLSQSFRDLWTNERLLNVMEQLLGTEDIKGNPVWNLRSKIPQNEATIVPWHQDASYMESANYSMLLVTAWIPLLDANKENGGLQMIKGGHRSGKVAKHENCWASTWYTVLQEEELEKTLDVNIERDSVVCDVPFGGLVLFNNITPHRSLPNTSDVIRWSFDFRWQREDTPVAFYDLKPAVQMRSSKEKAMKIDWTEFDSINRHVEQAKTLGQDDEGNFDVLMMGPWMKRWPITNTNRHVDAFLKAQGSQSV